MAQLQFAFKVWCVRPFETVQKAPDAADLLENIRQLSAEEWSRAEADLEKIIARVLDRVMPAPPRLTLSAAEVAHVLATAVPGFKVSARSATQLRRSIRDLLSLVLAGLGVQTS